jgi:hypothetical protein
MDLESEVETVEELIDGLISEHGNNLSVGFDQSSVAEVSGMYSVRFVCVLDGILPSQVGDIDIGPLPLTDANEYVVNPSFKFTTEHPDTVFVNNGIYRASTVEGGEPKADIELLEMVCSEVHLEEQRFTEIAEQGEGAKQIVECVEVCSYDSRQQKAAEFLGAMIAGNPAPPQQTPDEGLHFFVGFRVQEQELVDGLDPRHRFDHVETVTLGDQQYPSTIVSDVVDSPRGGRGLWIHTSDFLATYTDAPKIRLSNELDRIDWAEFFASNRPWPEPPRQTADQ